MIDIKPLLDFAQARTTPQQVTITAPGVEPFPAYVTGDGKLASVASLVDEQRLTPRRRKGEIRLSDVWSFVELVNRDARPGSVIFASDRESPSLTAVLNYHGEHGADPAFCDDRIVYPFPLSDEWKTWTRSSKRSMGQQEFAEFIEANAFDVGGPAEAGATAATWAERGGVRFAGPAEMMGVSKGLSVRVEESVQNHVRLESGEVRMEWSTEHKGHDGQAIKVPAAFHLLIPILHGGAQYSIPARLRYRAANAKVTWFYELHKPEFFLRDAVREVVERVGGAKDAGGCGLPIYMGTPPG